MFNKGTNKYCIYGTYKYSNEPRVIGIDMFFIWVYMGRME